MNLPNGHLLQNGKYRLTHVVGQGGFGITYKGIWYTEVKGPLGTVKTEVPVCIKEYFFKDYCYRDADSFAVKVHSDTGKTLFHKFKEKLIKEAKILSEVHHPYIVNVLEVFEENNTAYIAMEYISGSSLKQRMEQVGILPEAQVLKYVRQIGTALQFVHEKHILHLDIKPSNVLIDKDDQARLIDFGVSKRYDMEQQETSTTMLTLSKGFASIEQYDNEGTQSFSPCPDIYSLGATMYNLLTGKIPTESILRATRPLPKPSELNAAITPKTEAVIWKAMEIVPANRFQTVREMLEALDLPPLAVPSPQQVQPVPEDGLATSPDERGGETTCLSSGRPLAEDEERTLLNTSQVKGEESAITPVQKRGHRRLFLIVVGVVLFVLAGSSVAFWLYSDRVSQRKNRMAETVVESPVAEKHIPETTIPSESREESLPEPEAEVPFSAAQEKETLPKKEPEKREAVQQPQPVQSRPAAPDQQLLTPSTRLESAEEKPAMAESSAATLDVRYAELLAAGKERMAAADYGTAHQLLAEAKETKLTEEVVRLLITCDERAEEKRIADRKALYEEKMDFGKYKIVRKKSTGRYGAIDANGEERIPCKYLSVGKTDNGRAFEREDNLFDIYRPDGTLVNSGVTYY